jgi:hypothetical protein
MVARGGVLNESTVYEIASVFDHTEIFEHRAELVVKSSLDGVIAALLK